MKSSHTFVRSGYTMKEVVDRLSEDYGWSDSVSNLSNKLQRESLRYVEAVQLADALGYDLVWQRAEGQMMPAVPAIRISRPHEQYRSIAMDRRRKTFDF